MSDESVTAWLFFLLKVYLDGTVLPGIDLPGPRSEHCIIDLNGKPYITGGNIGPGKQTSIVLTTKNGSDDFEDLLDMNFPRSNHGCGWMYSEAHAGHPLLVVTGGITYRQQS